MLINQFNNLKIRSKLVLFLIVPILTLLYFSISGMHLKYEEQVQTNSSLDFISLSLSLADLIHELQKERGLSAGFVGSQGGLHKEQLLNQRNKTDEKYQLFLIGLSKKELKQLNLVLYELFNRFKSMLEQLPDMRSDIDALMKGNYFNDYSDINQLGLNLNMHMQTQILDIQLMRHNDAYNTLLWLQERSGQERGLLNGVFSSGKLSANQFNQLSAYSVEQETLITHFFTVASMEQRSLFQDKMKHSVMKEVKIFQLAAINKASKNDLLNGLQILIGYGGLIHNFKNYLIRAENSFADVYDDLYVNAISILDKYRNLQGMSQKEIDSLNTVEATFLEYKEHLQLISNLREKGVSISEIDMRVKVDDKPALVAIQYLHKSVTGLDTSVWWDKSSARIQLIKEVSDSIRLEMLTEAQQIRENTTKSLYLYIVLTIGSFALSGLLGYLLLQRIVGGIINIADHMTSMQEQDDFTRTINISGRDELSDVARAFNKLIEHRKTSEQQLKLAASVFKSTNEAITVTDSSKKIILVNPAFTKITGYTQEEVIGKNPSILQSGKHDSNFYRKMWDALREDGHWIGEILNRRKNGEIYPEMLNISAIKNEDGKVIMYIGMFLDITKRKQAEEKQDILQRQLLQAQKMEALGQLTGGIAHDFNNMLASILGYTSLVEDRVKEKEKDDKLQGYLSQITLAGNRAKHVVTQLLAYTRTDTDAELEPLNVTDLLHESIKMIRPLLPSTIELVTHFEPDQAIIMSSPVMVHQVVMNLCINARDAIGDHGSIVFDIQKVSLDEVNCSSCHNPLSGEFIEVSINDTGSGIDATTMENLFDPFFTTKEMGSEKGTGMGLAMVHGIMHKFDGHIIVESRVGEGSKFKLLFPMCLVKDIKKSEVTENIEPVTNDNSVEKTCYNILCVDDELSLVTLMTEILEGQGHKVSAFTDSNKALASFSENPHQYDLVITDQTMPKLTGSEMAKAMIEVKPGISIILCSGYSDNIDKEGAESIGITAYMAKPLDMQALYKVINQLDIDSP